MVKLQFTNATVKDSGYGLEVNGESLEDMISVALGTKRNGKKYNNLQEVEEDGNSEEIKEANSEE